MVKKTFPFLIHQISSMNQKDLDLLEIGNSGLTLAEQLTHFVFWAAAK